MIAYQSVQLTNKTPSPFVLLRYKGTGAEPGQSELCVLLENRLQLVLPDANKTGWRAAFELDLFGNPARALPKSAVTALLQEGRTSRTIGKNQVEYVLVHEHEDAVEIWDSCAKSIQQHKEWKEAKKKQEETSELDELRKENRRLRDELRTLKDDLSLKGAIKRAVARW